MVSWLRNAFGSQSSGNAIYNPDATLVQETKPLTYQECIEIYQNWALGKRVASALPNVALSVDRNVTFKDLPKECEEHYKKVLINNNINQIMKDFLINVRVFGMCTLFINIDGVEPDEAFSQKLINSKNNWRFSILDPLVTSGSNIEMDPLKINYMEFNEFYIAGKVTHLSRVYTAFNDMQFYLKWIDSNFAFGSPSVYQNLASLIPQWQRCVIALERAATKAGSIIYKSREAGSILTATSAQALRKNLDIIRNMQNDGIASIEKDASIELFNLTGISEIDAIINQLNTILLMALSDTPANILLNDKLSQGFGEGSEDMKANVMLIESYREKFVKPLYDFIDKVLLHVAFTDEFIKDLINEYEIDFKNMSIPLVREMILKNYDYTLSNLYPESENETQSNIGLKLDNMAKLRDLGANLADIEKIINSDERLYQQDISLDEANVNGDVDNEYSIDDYKDDESSEEEKQSKKDVENIKHVDSIYENGIIKTGY